jgi:glycosyltransferase involved in cell wall biosynthesis
MTPLRVLQVTPYFGEAWGYGGIPRIADALARGLSRRGHQVTVCTTDACTASTRLPTHATARTADGAEVRVFRNVSNAMAYHGQAFLPVGLSRWMERHAASFDIAHLHACRNLPGAIAAWHLQRAGVPYILAPNGTAPRIERRRLAKAMFDAVAGRRVLTGAASILAVTEAERRQLNGLGVPGSKVHVIPNPIELDEFAGPVRRGAFRQRLGIPDAPIVLFLGRQTPRKRVDVLVRAFARLNRPTASLVIAGNDGGAERATRALVAKLGLGARTIFTGLLRSAKRLEALADADVVVYPGQDEIFGLVPVESLLVGVPVVVAGDSGCAEVVRTTGGGQVVPVGDTDATARAIREVLDNPAHWRSAAAEAGPRVRDTFGAETVCEHLERMYLDTRSSAAWTASAS